MKNTSFYVSFKVGSSIDLGWISSTRVSLLYNGILIGEARFEDNYIIPDESNMVDFELQEMEIQNMLAFKAFIRHVIPQPRDRCQLKRKGPFAALEIVENGHMLSMAIHLDKMGVAEALDPVVHHADGRILAILEGEFSIMNADDDEQYVLTGNINPCIRLSGTAVLKGVCLDKNADTWFIHAIRQFEMEINLDEVIYGKR
ncbi:hypothetical protein ACSS6W_001785 [Trichoderma asperelloides]